MNEVETSCCQDDRDWESDRNKLFKIELRLHNKHILEYFFSFCFGFGGLGLIKRKCVRTMICGSFCGRPIPLFSMTKSNFSVGLVLEYPKLINTLVFKT